METVEVETKSRFHTRGRFHSYLAEIIEEKPWKRGKPWKSPDFHSVSIGNHYRYTNRGTVEVTIRINSYLFPFPRLVRKEL